MIAKLREAIERRTGLPIHYVAITELEQRPCGSIGTKFLDTHQELQKANGFAVTGVQLTLFADDYETLDDLADKFRADFDGQRLALVDGDREVKIYIDDSEDDAFPAGEGSDDWIYSREIDLRVHHKLSEGKRGR